MARARQGRPTWRQTTVHLTRATATVFTGPGDDWTLVVHGRKDGGSKVATQSERKRSTKGRQ